MSRPVSTSTTRKTRPPLVKTGRPQLLLSPVKPGPTLSGHSIKIPEGGGFARKRLPVGVFLNEPVLSDEVGDSFAEETRASKEILLNESVLQPVAPAAGPVEQPHMPDSSDTFGIPPDKLTNPNGATYLKFLDFQSQALAWQEEKGEKSSYETKDVDGDLWVTRKKGEEPLSVRHQAWQARTGRAVENGFIKVANAVRESTNCPRTTGSKYGTAKPKEDLLCINKQRINDTDAAIAATAKALNQVPANYFEYEDPILAEQLAPETGAVMVAPGVLGAVDTTFALAAHLRWVSDIEKAKNDLNYVGAAGRFADRFVPRPEKKVHFASNGENRAKEADSFVKLINAGDKVLQPTQEDKSTGIAAEARVQRAAGSAAVAAAGAGIDIANTVGSITPAVSVILPPVTAAVAVIEIREGKHEVLRRNSQKAQAKSRKEKIDAVLENPKYINHPDYKLAQAIGDCFKRQQDRLIGQGNREKTIAEGRVVKAGANLGMAAGTVVVGALVGTGVLSVATAGVALAVPAAIGAAWGGTLAYRNLKRVRGDHTSKWRERMVQGIALTTSREELEAKLTAENTRIRFEQEEGEYLFDKECFAGNGDLRRVMDLEARDNEYLGLRLLALKVQDMIKSGKYDENSPCIQLVHALGIDPLLLLAICTAAKPKKPAEQLAYVESQLAPKVGMKVRMAGATQAPPHVSVFLEHFKTARDEAFMEKAGDDFEVGLENDFDGDAWRPTPTDSPELYPKIREKLAKLYPNDPQAGLETFDKAIGIFLEKVEKERKKEDLPQTQFVKTLSGFVNYSTELREEARRQAEIDVQREAAKAAQDETTRQNLRVLTENRRQRREAFRAERQRMVDVNSQATDLIKQLEQFNSRPQTVGGA